MRVKVKTNTSYLDLSKDTDNLFYITLQLYDLGQLNNRKSDFSRELTIPNTQNNREALDIASNIIQNFKSIPCTLSIDDINFAAAKIIISEFTKKTIDINIVFGNFDLFEQIPNESIRELDFSEFDIPWDITNVAAAATNTEGLVIGSLSWFDDPTLDNGLGAPIECSNYTNISSLGFCFYLKTIAKKIVENVGYTLVDTAFDSDEYYQNAVVCSPVLVPAAGSSINANWAFNSDYIYDDTNLGLPANLPFDRQLIDPLGLWDNTNKYYVIQTAGDYDASFTYNIDFLRDVGTGFVRIMQNGVQQNVFLMGVTGNYTGTLSARMSCQVNDQIYVEIEAGYQNQNRFDIIQVDFNSNFQLVDAVDDPTGNLVVSDWIADMNQRSFLRSFLSLYNAILNATEFTKEAEIKPFNDLYSEIPRNLTANLYQGDDDTNLLALDTYFKKSLLTFNNDSTVDRGDKEYIESFNNDALAPTGTILYIESFSCSDDTYLENMVGIKTENHAFEYSSLPDFSIGAGSSTFTFLKDQQLKAGDYIRIGDRIDRIATVLNKRSGQFFNTFSGAVSGDCEYIKVNYNEVTPRLGHIDLQGADDFNLFTSNGWSQYIPSQGNQLKAVKMENNMANTRDRYYAKIFQALKFTDVIEVYMVFTPLEMYQLLYDFVSVIEIDGYNGKYYINRIMQWKLNQPCLVELVRINAL